MLTSATQIHIIYTIFATHPSYKKVVFRRVAGNTYSVIGRKIAAHRNGDL